MPGRRGRSSRKAAPSLMFYERLVLNKYFLSLFGKERFKDLANELKRVDDEGYDENNNTYYYRFIKEHYCEADNFLDADTLLRYDENIVRHTKKISEKRGELIKWKYFQYLTLLFTEIYLDWYFKDREGFLERLNTFAANFDSSVGEADQVGPYTLDSLNKVAFWNATGSGKTLIMHVNILQYLHYLKRSGKEKDLNRIILLTPNEGLSQQHLDEMILSGFSAKIFEKDKTLDFYGGERPIEIIDIHKLKDEGKEKTVSVEAFEGNNLVLVDEGHKGTGGEEWMDKRNRLCAEGFSFEYSATFGQAMKAAKDKELVKQYAKCILFDYSYKYFYEDGFGKDYNILNLADDSDANRKKLYLTACLLTFYQQLRIYKDKFKEIQPFNIEKPLMVFVGAYVSAGSNDTQEKRNMRSDVADVLEFFANFIRNKQDSMSMISRLLSGKPGLLDDKGREIFAKTFSYLTTLKTSGLTEEAIYEDVLKLVFNCTLPGAKLRIENLKGANGELGLRVGEDDYFGVINIGDEKKLLDLIEERGLITDEVSLSDSLFSRINHRNSDINVLIGSKKFVEGWNSWRVSTMGLVNFGRSEGSMVIQLFGRGVRLRGYNNTLKRSNKIEVNRPQSVPQFIKQLETLYIFGVKADYMQQFKEYLDNEGVQSNEEFNEVYLPVKKRFDDDTLGKLKTIRLENGINFKKQARRPVLSLPDEDMKSSLALNPIVIDWYPKIQSISSNEKHSVEGKKEIGKLNEKHLSFIDFDDVFFEIERYKNEKAWYNLSITKRSLIDLMKYSLSFSWYTLYIPPQDLEFNNFENFRMWQDIVVALLKKYCDFYYNFKRSSWERPYLTYETLKEDDANFIAENQYSIYVYNDEARTIENIIKKLREEIAAGKLRDIEVEQKYSYGNFVPFDFERHLYSPLICIEKGGTRIDVSPLALNSDEKKFVVDLRDYYYGHLLKFKKQELYLLRNRSRAGIGFFEANGFYPDFILWILKDEKQYVTFIDPKGIRFLDEGFENKKITFYKTIKDIESQIRIRTGDDSVILNSFILSRTPYEIMEQHWHKTKAEIESRNVLFMQDSGYIEKLLRKILV